MEIGTEKTSINVNIISYKSINLNDKFIYKLYEIIYLLFYKFK